MAVIRTWDFICKGCNHRFFDTVDVEDPEIPSCPGCDCLEVEKVIGAPMVMQNSWPDGHRRKTDGDYQRILDANKLKGTIVNKTTSDVAGTKKEINKILEVKK
jgi:putative FmdB family regulatory protein